MERTTQASKSERSTEAAAHSEGKVAKAIEHQTAKLPSDVFLWAAGIAVATSLAMQLSNRKHLSLFIGEWVPSFLLLGVYNKIVKVAGSDRLTGGHIVH